MSPSFLNILRMMYWTALGDRKAVPHLLAALAGSLRNFVVFRFRRRFVYGAPIMAVALTEHMGDIIAGEPVSRLARAQFPSARIHWIVRRPYRSLISNYPAVDEAIVVQCLTEWLLLWSYGLAEVAWDLHLSERACPRCRVAFRKLGPAGELTYATYYDRGNLLAVECMSAGLVPLSAGPVLTSDASAVRRVDELLLPERFVVIHCISSESRRDWSNEKWAELVEHLTGTLGVHVVEIGSSPHVIASDGPLARSLCGALSIMETAEVVRRAQLFIGIDSGPAHMANAVGTQGVILLGHYHNFHRYMPYSGLYQTEQGATLLWADGLVASLPVKPVIQAVERRIAMSDRGKTFEEPI